MNAAERKIISIIRTIRRRWLTRQFGLFMAIATGMAIGWLSAMVMLDNLLMFSSAMLLAGWGVLIISAATCAGLLGYHLTVGRPSPSRFALTYERHTPTQRNRLINAVQLMLDDSARRDPMAQAVVQENAALLDPTRCHEAVDYRPLRPLLMLIAALSIVLLGYVMVRPGASANALARLFTPAAPPDHLFATNPTATPGDVQIIEGQPLTITASLRQSLPPDRHPDQVFIEYQVGDQAWARRTAQPADEHQYRHTFDAVWHPMRYRIRAGRSVSTIYHVTLRYRPRVSQLRLSVTPPKYSGRPTRQIKPQTGDVAALVGSTVDIALTGSQPLRSAALELAGLSPIPLRLSPTQPSQASGQFQLTASGSYTIRLTDQAGLTSANPPRYALTAEPDEPPGVVISRPARDLVLPINGTLDLAIEADDDIGLGQVAVEIRRPGSDWQAIRRWPITPRGIRHGSYSLSLSPEQLGLAVDQVIHYRAVAADYAQPKPNRSVGRTWSLTIAQRADQNQLLTAQARQLLEALKRILALQTEARAAIEMDQPVPPAQRAQQQVRQLTIATLDQQRQALRPPQMAMAELERLADGPMLRAIQLINQYDGAYAHRQPRKAPLIEVMDHIIDSLRTLIGKVDSSLAVADQAARALEQLAPRQREQAMKTLRDTLEKLRRFVPEQDKVIADTEELARKGEDFTGGELQKIEQLKGTEDKWAAVFTDSVRDIMKLTEQLDLSGRIANDYKEMVEQIEQASKNLTPQLITLAVPREQAGREMATALVEEMEMWLPSSPDHIKWVMEEPLDRPEIPMIELPDQLSDLIGELIEDQDALNDAAEDVTSAWADSIAEGAGWQVADGPISNFSAVGKTGNQLPDNHELSGRAGDGRSGRSQGQLVENVAKGLAGRKTPTRITNDPYEQGVVKELQQMATGGATGGGKARGSGQEGLQGSSPPPQFAQTKFMQDWQQRIRQKAQRIAGQLKMVRVSSPDLDPIIELMQGAEQSAEQGRYQEMFQRQQMVLQRLEMAEDLVARDVALRVDRAYYQPADQRPRMLDAAEEPVPQEYRDAVKRYFERLSAQ